MAKEDDEPKDREVWSGVARFWYSKASTKNTTVGRLYYHLAVLAVTVHALLIPITLSCAGINEYHWLLSMTFS